MNREKVIGFVKDYCRVFPLEAGSYGLCKHPLTQSPHFIANGQLTQISEKNQEVFFNRKLEQKEEDFINKLVVELLGDWKKN